MIYLDYNATTPVYPQVAEAVSHALGLAGNPSSVHGAGRMARSCIEKARESVASLTGVRPSQVIFTSGGTEANHLALAQTEECLISAVEHDSILERAESGPGKAGLISVDKFGIVDIEGLERLLIHAAPGTLVSVMLANNETGVIQPVKQIADLAHNAGALVHCDAVQALGKIPVNFADLGVDLLTISAHKIGGPKGVGVLIVRNGISVYPTIRGGGQEMRRRAGTENLPGIAGFGRVAELARAGIADMPRIQSLRDSLETHILTEAPEAQIIGTETSRVGNTSCIVMPGVPAETQVMALDLAGVCVSAGSACSSGKVKPSHVLMAMGKGEDIARSSIRISFGWGSNVKDIEGFMSAWLPLYRRTRKKQRAAV